MAGVVGWVCVCICQGFGRQVPCPVLRGCDQLHGKYVHEVLLLVVPFSLELDESMALAFAQTWSRKVNFVFSFKGFILFC